MNYFLHILKYINFLIHRTVKICDDSRLRGKRSKRMNRHRGKIIINFDTSS